MFSGFAGLTSMSGSLFGNRSSQSRFVLTPPLVAKHSNSHKLRYNIQWE